MDNSGRFRRPASGEMSSADLLRECGRKLTDRALWTTFQERFHSAILLYILRTLKFHSKRGEVEELVADLAQEVYVRLMQNNGELLSGFRGKTDFSVKALFARVCTSAVADHLRRGSNLKRMGDNIVSLEEARAMLEGSKTQRDESDFEAILSWIDIERVVAADQDQKNPRRNALIFKLHYMDGLTAEEIARYPGFELNSSGVETVLRRLLKRIRK